VSKITFHQFSLEKENFVIYKKGSKKKLIECNFCGGNFFSKISRDDKEYLECKCGNKMSKEDCQHIRKPNVEKYEKFMDSIQESKDDFLINIRNENFDTDKERVGIFVDIQNVYYGAKDSFNGKVDFQKLLNNVLKKRKLVKANVYLIDSKVNNRKFMDCLNLLGYTIRIKNLKIRGDGSSKGNSDIEMAIDVLNECDKIDTAALITGDGDFVPLVEYLKSKNIRVEVYSFSKYKNSTAYDLKECADYFYEIDRTYLFEKKMEKI